MYRGHKGLQKTLASLMAASLLTTTGCRGVIVAPPAPGPRPFEGVQVTIDEYIAQPPDVLLIEMEANPSDKQVIKSGDAVQIVVTNTLPEHPISQIYQVSQEGTVDLGIYGTVKIAGQTVVQAKETLKEHLSKELAEPGVSMQLAAARPISGEYLVRPDGKVKLGFYGEVHVAGKTLPEIEKAIIRHLEEKEGLVDPKVAVDVAAYNTMVYYIVTDGAGFGDQVTRQPLNGYETVLDALAEIGGMPVNGSKTNIWIARPIPGEPNAAEILPIDWVAITKYGSSATNYQILPGDRIYLKADVLVTQNNVFDRLISPFQQVLSTIILFNITTRSLGGSGAGFPFLGGFGT